MGSRAYLIQNERERLLGLILNDDYKYLVELSGTNKETKKPVRGAYQLFKELDEEKIRAYADTAATENNIELSKIEVWILEPELFRNIKPKDTDKK